jgi:hypothetical protein
MTSRIPGAFVVLQHCALRCWKACIREEAISSLFICVLKDLSIQALCDIHRGLGLTAVQHRKRLVAKLSQCGALWNNRRTPIYKELAALGKTGGIGNRERSLVEVTSALDGKRRQKHECQCCSHWAKSKRFHGAWIKKRVAI